MTVEANPDPRPDDPYTTAAGWSPGAWRLRVRLHDGDALLLLQDALGDWFFGLESRPLAYERAVHQPFYCAFDWLGRVLRTDAGREARDLLLTTLELMRDR